jgi:hypothetical protein
VGWVGAMSSVPKRSRARRPRGSSWRAGRRRSGISGNSRASAASTRRRSRSPAPAGARRCGQRLTMISSTFSPAAESAAMPSRVSSRLMFSGTRTQRTVVRSGSRRRRARPLASASSSSMKRSDGSRIDRPLSRARTSRASTRAASKLRASSPSRPGVRTSSRKWPDGAVSTTTRS